MGRELPPNEKYQESVLAIVVDEGYCLVNWQVSYYVVDDKISVCSNMHCTNFVQLQIRCTSGHLKTVSLWGPKAAPRPPTAGANSALQTSQLVQS